MAAGCRKSNDSSPRLEKNSIARGPCIPRFRRLVRVGQQGAWIFGFPQVTTEDGEIATPVPRACCTPFCVEPILAEIPGVRENRGEFVFLGECLAGLDTAGAL